MFLPSNNNFCFFVSIIASVNWRQYYQHKNVLNTAWEFQRLLNSLPAAVFHIWNRQTFKTKCDIISPWIFLHPFLQSLSNIGIVLHFQTSAGFLIFVGLALQINNTNNRWKRGTKMITSMKSNCLTQWTNKWNLRIIFLNI